jgi:hypothetical protein
MRTKTKTPVAGRGFLEKALTIARSALDDTTPTARGQVPIRAAGRVVGQVCGGTFHKTIRGSVHLLRCPPAIALDTQSLTDAEAAGAVRVTVRDAETDTVYTASIARIRARGFGVNRGHGEQLALPLHEWTTRRPGEAMQMQLEFDHERVT